MHFHHRPPPSHFKTLHDIIENLRYRLRWVLVDMKSRQDMTMAKATTAKT